MGRTSHWATLICCAAVLAVAGCGGDETTGDSTTAADTAATTAAESSTTSTTISSDIDAIEASIETWMIEGDCTLMTDRFLEEQTFDDNPESACKTFEAGFTPPAFSADDIDITDVKFENDKATAIVGGGPEGVSITAGGEEITSTYHLRFEEGTWKIDSAEIN